ncbi:class IV adenylate cyclase [Candidatus Pacearchaeota archaeon]|nr:class IV adenylate cyclase [Candidatus Pacearchaeota archaeon]
MNRIEVETKIPFKEKDLTLVRSKVKSIAKFVKKQVKKDDYYTLEYFQYPEKSLRVRDMGKIREVNFKKRISLVNGIHAKKEVQFQISDINGFFDLINDFGFRKWLHKEKTTELYKTKNGVNIELNYVKKLGWFLELEVLCSHKEVENARKKINDVRNALGFTYKDSEARGYTKQLWALNHK